MWAIPSAHQFRIGCSEAGAAGFVPAVIDQFSRHRPRVVFQIVTADPVTLIERELRRSGDLRCPPRQVGDGVRGQLVFSRTSMS